MGVIFITKRGYYFVYQRCNCTLAFDVVLENQSHADESSTDIVLSRKIDERCHLSQHFHTLIPKFKAKVFGIPQVFYLLYTVKLFWVRIFSQLLFSASNVNIRDV